MPRKLIVLPSIYVGNDDLICLSTRGIGVKAELRALVLFVWFCFQSFYIPIYKTANFGKYFNAKSHESWQSIVIIRKPT